MGNGLWVWAALLLAVLVGAGRNYENALEAYEPKGESSVRASRVNIVIWCCFWAAWTVYHVLNYFQLALVIPDLLWYSFGLACVPAVGIFAVTWMVRRSYLNDYPELKRKDNRKVALEGEYKALSFRYFSGFYSAIVPPLYLILLAIIYLSRTLH